MKIKVKMENCYGIKSLEREFDFSRGKIFSIYASNGVMKTSFAKTFSDVSLGQKTGDTIYPDRPNVRKIEKNNQDLGCEEVFVVMSYDEGYQSNRIATLLINKKLKSEYDKASQEIENARINFLEKIKEYSGLSVDDMKRKISEAICKTENEFYESIIRVRAEVEKKAPNGFL